MNILVWLSIVWACAACSSSGGHAISDTMPDAPDQMRLPIGFTFESADGTLTSIGWTGAVGFHDIAGAPEASFDVKVTRCDNGVCQFEGPVAPLVPGAVNRRRCLQQTSKTCTTDSDCPLDENKSPTHCAFIYDSPISTPLEGKDLSNGNREVGACAFTYIPMTDTDGSAAIQGTLNLSSGELNLGKLTERLVLNSTLSGTFQGVCPVCMGDTSPNDGVRGGTCQISPLPPDPDAKPDRGLPPDQGAKCDVNRYGNRSGYNYGFSMDCSPTPPPSIAKPTDFSGSFSSSGFRIAITDQSPKCTDPSFKDANCFCGMCSNSPTPTSCKSNADCSNNGTCVGASIPMTPPPSGNVPVAGNLCDNGICAWNEAEGVGTCTSARMGGIQVNCYPAAVLGTKGPDGKDVAITVPGRSMVQNNIYYADTASARCTGASPLQTVSTQVGLPGLTLHKRNFRIIPIYAEAQK